MSASAGPMHGISMALHTWRAWRPVFTVRGSGHWLSAVLCPSQHQWINRSVVPDEDHVDFFFWIQDRGAPEQHPLITWPQRWRIYKK